MPLLFCGPMQLGLPFGSSSEPFEPFEPFEPRERFELEPPEPPEPPESFEPPIDFYYVRHRRARRYLLRVDVDGRVRVTIPRGGSRREADAFASRQVDWIRRQQARRTPSIFSPDEERRLRQRARSMLPPRLLELAAQHELIVSRISIRNQRSRWGSCGRDGHICLNWRLVQMPEWVRDYVLIHELMHLRRMDHSPKYWKLVAAACPVYEHARAWLRAHGRNLR
jgi:predicted metal-dependent hydrolase